MKWGESLRGVSHCICNRCIRTTGDETIVFDTSATLSAAAELLDIATTGRVPRYVINSHSHPDHIHGNTVFDAPIISSCVTRHEIEQHGITEMQQMRSDMTTQLAQFKSQLETNQRTELERSELLSATTAFQSVLKGYPTEQDLRLPELTYEKSLNFHGTSRSAYLRSLGAAHPKCDSVL